MIKVHRNWYSGAITLSAIRKGEYCKYTYMGYTVKEALKDFRRRYPAR